MPQSHHQCACMHISHCLCMCLCMYAYITLSVHVSGHVSVHVSGHVSVLVQEQHEPTMAKWARLFNESGRPVLVSNCHNGCQTNAWFDWCPRELCCKFQSHRSLPKVKGHSHKCTCRLGRRNWCGRCGQSRTNNFGFFLFHFFTFQPCWWLVDSCTGTMFYIDNAVCHQHAYSYFSYYSVALKYGF